MDSQTQAKRGADASAAKVAEPKNGNANGAHHDAKKASKLEKARAKKAKAVAKHEKAPKPPPQYPDALVAFMMTEWAPRDGKAPEPIKNVEAFLARRRALSKAFPGEVLVIPTGHEKVRSNDTTYRFRPGSDFFYLTGNLEPDCVLVLVPKGKNRHTDVLFVEPNNGRSDKTFFTDHAKGELWVGARLGVPESGARFGASTSAEACPSSNIFSRKPPRNAASSAGSRRRPRRSPATPKGTRRKTPSSRSTSARCAS